MNRGNYPRDIVSIYIERMPGNIGGFIENGLLLPPAPESLTCAHQIRRKDRLLSTEKCLTTVLLRNNYSLAYAYPN